MDQATLHPRLLIRLGESQVRVLPEEPFDSLRSLKAFGLLTRVKRVCLWGIHGLLHTQRPTPDRERRNRRLTSR